MESVMELSVEFDKLVQQSPIPLPALAAYLHHMKSVPSGPLVTTKLLAGKIQSSSETQALKAFDFLEAALDSETEGSIEFRTEVGRFRFLNEIIRILSPKFLATQTPDSVKERAIKFVTEAAGTKRRKWFPSEHAKIDAVYSSLVEGGIIQEGAADHDPDAEFQKSIFERGENAILLKKLLQSKNPNDIQAANRLIKNLVEEEAKRNERRAEIHSLVDQIDTTTTLLRELLSQSTVDYEIVEELASSSRSLRNRLGSIGTETNEETNALVQASESIESVLELYERKKAHISSDRVAGKLKEEVQKPTLSLADELLISLDLGQTVKPESQNKPTTTVIESDDLLHFGQDIIPETHSSHFNDFFNTSTNIKPKVPTHFDELDKISRSLLEHSLVGTESSETRKTESKFTLSQLIQNKQHSELGSRTENVHNITSQISAMDLDYLERSTTSQVPAVLTTKSTTTQKPVEDENLLVIQTDSTEIKLSNLEKQTFSLDSINALDFESIEPVHDDPQTINLGCSSIELTITQGRISSYPNNIRGIIISLTNRNPTFPLSDYSFQLLPPKGTRVKLFPPSTNTLESWRKKFLPPQYLTQGGLISMPLATGGNGIKLKLILTYYLGDDAVLHNSEFELK